MSKNYNIIVTLNNIRLRPLNNNLAQNSNFLTYLDDFYLYSIANFIPIFIVISEAFIILMAVLLLLFTIFRTSNSLKMIYKQTEKHVLYEPISRDQLVLKIWNGWSMVCEGVQSSIFCNI